MMAVMALPILALQRRLFDHIDLRVRNRARAQEFFAKVLPAIGFALDKSAEQWGAFEKDGARHTLGVLWFHRGCEPSPK
jgi:hypothetical protein